MFTRWSRRWRCFPARCSARRCGSGLLPVWTSWWDEPEVAGLFRDAGTRSRLAREHGSRCPTSRDLYDRPGAYLTGDTYGRERDEAERRRWPVSTLPAEHLHLLNDPDQVATELMSRLGISAPTG